jgi:hypothetical protein
MELDPHINTLREQLAVAAEAGGEEARALAERLSAPLDAAIRLMLLDALSVAAAEITRELAPGSVELRLRGRDPEFAVTAPPGEPAREAESAGADAFDLGDGGVARINLRLPDRLKGQVEQAADRDGVSINAWLVRAAAVALERREPIGGRSHSGPRGGQRYTGWGR